MPKEWEAQFHKSASVTCVIEADSTIIYCNPAWDRFALQNNGIGATADYVVGRWLFAYIPAVLKLHYRKLIDTARRDRRIVAQDYECPSADMFQKYHLKILPIPHTNLVAMVHSLCFKHAMDIETVLPTAYHHGTGNVVTMCAQCRRTKRTDPSRWDWLPDFVRTPPRRVSHGICPDCAMYLLV